MLTFTGRTLLAGLLAFPVVLVARFVAVRRAGDADAQALAPFARGADRGC